MKSEEKNSPEEKKLELFYRQKALLETFLATGAITPAQFEKSFSCMREKMDIDRLEQSIAKNGKHK